MKTYNNEKAGTPQGHWFDDIMDNIKEGDEFIDGFGVLHICVYATRYKDGDFGGLVEVVEAKKDRTIHKGRRAEAFIKWRGFWERRK